MRARHEDVSLQVCIEFFDAPELAGRCVAHPNVVSCTMTVALEPLHTVHTVILKTPREWYKTGPRLLSNASISDSSADSLGDVQL
jgi:hypothetical protein